MNFDYPARLRFRCTKCAICCGDTDKKTRCIILLSAEAQQIAWATSQQICRFAAKIEGKEPYSYEMKKKTSDGKCLFLEDGRCTIYSLRPLICRFYPFELKIVANGKHQFFFTEECPAIGKGNILRKSYFEKLFRSAQTKAKAENRFTDENR